MKKTLSLLIALLLCVSAFSGCDNVLPQNGSSQTTDDTINTNAECEHNWERIGNLNESTAQDRCTKCGETRLYTDPDSINKPNDEIAGMKGTKVWDWHHPDDSERNPEWAITFASMPNVEFKRENSSVYANDELLIGGPGYVCMSFYTAELTVTNKTLLCFGMSLGSGICDERIVIMDFDTKQELFAIHDRMNYDYQLFVRNGILCVREMKYGTNEITRTGIFYDEGTKIQILWDEHIVLDEDRDPVQNDQPTDSNTECVHILKDGFAFKESWIDSNNELTESKTFVVESQEALNEIFTEFKDVNFDKEMVIVYCYTTIYIREQKLEKVSFDNNVLSIEFDVVDGKPGTGDATAPQTRTCVICLDKVAATEVKITYNGQ